MATPTRSRGRRGPKPHLVHKPNGVLHPRIQAVGPEHFAIVAVDCAKARSKLMVTDYFGSVLVPPTFLPHRSAEFQAAIASLRTLFSRRAIRDVVVAVERTGRYHQAVKRAFAAAGFEVRVVHPYATKQFRQPADPGNKTDDTDLSAIHRATVNGFGLSEQPWPETYVQLQLVARHRRDLVRKAVVLRCQIREHLHAFMPGFENCFEDIFESDIASFIIMNFDSPGAILRAGVARLTQVARQAGVHFQARSLEAVLAWARDAPEGEDAPGIHRRIVMCLEQDRTAKRALIRGLERDLAALLVQTPYILLLGIPGINVVSAAELAGEMGPIEHYRNSRAITGRAGLYPSRHQSDRVDRCDGPLVRASNRTLRQALLMIADNLVTCNEHFGSLNKKWREAGKDARDIRVKVACRFSRILYQMVAGSQGYHHPSGRHRHYVLDKLIKFHNDHSSEITIINRDLEIAVAQLPRAERGVEAAPLAEQLGQVDGKRGPGPRSLGAILPAVLARLGVFTVESTPSGESTLK
jgi:transposase